MIPPGGISVFVCGSCTAPIGTNLTEPIPPGTYEARLTIITDCAKCHRNKKGPLEKGGATPKVTPSE
jgi:hypothetical protein